MSTRTAVEGRRYVRDVPYEGDAVLLDAITSVPGASGGAVVALDGGLVGMVGPLLTGESTQTRVNFAVPVDRLYGFLHREDAGGSAETTASGGAPELGLRVFRLGGRRSPAYIGRVLPGSPAAKAGLRKDDLVVAVGAETVRNCGEYIEASRKLRPGREVQLTIKRGTEIKTVTVTVGAKAE
jgi:S1-C subfamily serine protease